MKITLGKIWDSRPALQKLVRLDMPVKSAYWVNRVAAKLDVEIGQIEAARVELVRKYGELRDDGEYSVTEPDKLLEFWNELNPLLAEEIELDLQPIGFGLLEGIRLSPADLQMLDPFLTELGE